MNGYSRLGVNLLLAVLIAFILADVAYFASGYLRQSAFYIAAAVFVAALASAILAVEIFSVSRDSSHVKRHIRRTKLERLAQRLVLSRMEEEESYARAEHMMANQDARKADSIEQISGSITVNAQEQQISDPEDDAKVSKEASAEPEDTAGSEETNKNERRKTITSEKESNTQASPEKQSENTQEQEASGDGSQTERDESMPSENDEDDARCSLLIANLTPSASTESVKAFVQKFGEASDIKIIRQGSKKKKRVSAVVEMKGISAHDAIAKMNGQTLAGKTVSVTEASTQKSQV